MNIKSIAAYLALGLASVGCADRRSKVIEPPKLTVQVDEQEQTQNSDLKRGKGALENAEWEVIYQKKEISFYKVRYKDKDITVVADWHTKPGRNVVAEIVKEVEKEPENWALLVENLDRVEEITPEIKAKVGMAVSLPHGGDGMSHLLDSKLVEPKDMALAYGVSVLDRIATGIHIPDEAKEDPLEFICTHIVESFEEDNGITLDKDEVKQMILNETSTPEKLEKAVEKAKHLFWEMAAEASDKMITEVVQDALEKPYKHYLIHMGEGHLRSLINSGPLLEYTENLIAEVTIKAELVQRSLDASKK